MSIREGINRALKLGGATSRSNCQRQREVRHHRLDGSQHAYTRPRIAQHTDVDDAWDHLLERAKPLPAHCVFKVSEARDIAARMRHAVHESSRNWVKDLTENKGDGACRLLKRRQWRCTATHNHFGCKAYEFLSQRFHTSCITACPAGLDSQVPALNPTQVLEPSF